MITKTSSILDYSYPFLDPAVWDQDMKLYSYQKDFILRLLDKMYETYSLKEHEKWVEDVVILGSLTTTKWLLSSDLDVHVRVNLDEFVKTNMPNVSKEEAFAKLDETRKEFDRAKILAPMTQHPTEFYIESLELHPSNTEAVGVYSLYQDKWLKEPIALPAELDIEESKRKVVEEAEALAQELDGSIGKVKRDIQRIDELENVIKAWGKDKQKLFYTKIEKKLNDIEEEIKKDLKIKQDLVDYRHSNQDPTSENEILFKYLARNGFFLILQNLKELLESTGGEVTTEELPLIEKVISQGNLKEAGQIIRTYTTDGEEVRIYQNPTFSQVKNLLNKFLSKGGLRYIIDEQDVLYVWDAFSMTHEDAEDQLGIGYASVQSFIEKEEDIKNLFNSRTQVVSMQKFAAFMKKSNVKEDIKQADNEIYVDVDDTLFHETKDFKIGEPIEGAREGLLKLKELGYTIVLDSHRCNTEEGCNDVKVAMKKYDMPYDKIYDGKKPLAKYYIDDRAIHFDNWSNVLKQVGKPEKKASLRIVAYNRSQAVWIAPEGKIYPVKDTHEDWMFDNRELLQNQYGYKEDTAGQSWWDIKTINLLRQLLRDGWARVGDIYVIKGEGAEYGKRYEGFGIEIGDLRNIPNGVIDYILQSNLNSIILEDLSKRYVIISRDDFSDIQGIVNRKLTEKTVHASLSHAYWIDPNGKVFQVRGSEFGKSYSGKDTHDGWIKNNLLLLKYDYGIEPRKDQWGEHLDSRDLIEKGWVRIGDSHNRDWGVSVKSLNNIPSHIDNILAQFVNDGAKIEIDDANNNYQEIEWPVKSIQQAVNKAMQQSKMVHASSDWPAAFWVDPSGKIYNAEPTHDEWVRENRQLLKEKYGLDTEKMFGPNVGLNTINYIISQGWTRISIASNNKDFVANVYNLRNVPNNVIDFLLTAPEGSKIVLEDKDSRNYVVVDKEDLLSGQKGINKAIQRKQSKLFSKKEITAQTKKVKQGDYSCLMALVPHDLAQEIVEFGVRIVPDDKIYLDEDGNLGRELESHITIKYGLLTNEAKDVRRSFNNEKPFKAKLGKVKHFQPPELPFDVLTVEVISEDLEKANKKVCDNFECAEGLISDEYHPHITIAYMKRDTAKEYIGSDIFESKELELDTLVFSPHKGNRTYFSISNDKESRFILERINKQSSGNNFYPSLVQAPNNPWQSDSDLEIPVDPDPVSDESTVHMPCTTGKPRSVDVWKQILHMLKKPFSKKESGVMEKEEWDSNYGDIWHVGDKVKDKNTGKIGVIKSINGSDVELEEVTNGQA